MGKKLVSFMMAVMFVFALHSVVTAGAEVLYVQEDNTKGYEETNTGSRVIKTFNAADQILVEQKSGGFVGVLAEDPDGDGQTIAWIPADRLDSHIPQSRCPHEWGAWNVVSEPTCTDPGYTQRFCNLCGMMEDGETPALGHDWGEPQVDTQPTCTSEGLQTQTCARCGVVQGVDIPRIDHSFGDWTVSKKATCTEEGTETRKCSMCGLEETRSIAMIPHTYGAWKETKKATCTEEGEETAACTVCKHEEKRAIQKLPHTFDDWKVTKEATCTETGERTHTCRVCKLVEKETIEMLPHELEEKIIKETTDHSSGIRCKICKKCGFKTDEEEFDPEGTLRRGDSGEEVQKMQQLLVDQGFLGEGGADGKFGGGTENALMEFQLSQHLTPDGVGWPQTLKRLNHEYGPWTVTRQMTRSEAGERTRVCKDCGYEQKESIEAEPSYVRRESGDDVAAIQKMITAVGFNAGEPDGVFGKLLNEAFTNLGKEKGFEFTEDKITAANVDALVNTWIGSLSPQNLKGQGRTNDPVSLALTVREVTSLDDVYTEDGNEIVTYQWTLKNLGSADCHVYALLLNYGGTPDFGADNIVTTVCGQLLQADGANTATGTFIVPKGGYAKPEEPAEEQTEEVPEEAETETLAEAQTETLAEAETETLAETVTEAAAPEPETEPLQTGPMNFCAVVSQDGTDAVWCSNVITME